MSGRNRKRKLIETLKKRPFLVSLLAAVPPGLIMSFLILVPTVSTSTLRLSVIENFSRQSLLAIGQSLLVSFISSVIAGLVLAAFVVYPLVLTGIECYLLLRFVLRPKKPQLRYPVFDVITIPLGILYSCIYLSLMNVMFDKDWTETLFNAQRHTPVYTQSTLTIWVIAIIGFIGYLIVSLLPLKDTPPLLLVLGMSAMYLGTIESIVWGYQVFQDWLDSLPLLLLPFNCILITSRTILYKIREWETLPHDLHKISRVPFLRQCNHILDNARLWPLAAFLLMWPLLGILIAVLVLFGQAPDSVIRAWTETSDWNLSKRAAPQNIYYDEHYLCTVAAGGHERIVKPLRLGVRHGHEVIVNRQLCVANAFEQVLEERTPRFHRAVRNFYDKYGFPAARLIRSKYTADFVYFLMKPLEWLFLAVLYLTEAHPEDRIAIQYMGRP